MIIIPTEHHAIDFLEPVHITHGQVCSDEIDNVPEGTSIVKSGHILCPTAAKGIPAAAMDHCSSVKLHMADWLCILACFDAYAGAAPSR